MNVCMFCGHPAPLVHVHGHYQCGHCGTNAMPCCDADNCHTNVIAPLNQEPAHEVQAQGKPTHPVQLDGQQDIS